METTTTQGRTRLEVLRASLEKKEAEFARRLDAYMDDVRSANGQPLNDKRCGASTLARWDRKNESLKALEREIIKTREAIYREEARLLDCAEALEALPSEIVALIEEGTLKQWRKHPNTLFVEGVSKARLQWDAKRGRLEKKYDNRITDEGERRRFAEVYDRLAETLKTK